MQTIFSSVLAASLLATLTISQPLHSAVIENGAHKFGQDQVQPAPGDPFASRGRGWALAHPAAHSGSEGSGLSVYVVTDGQEFGAIDLRTGAFIPIGPGTPADVGMGLVRGPGASLLTLTFSGNLASINPRTGLTSVVGSTGLGDCSTPASPCGPNSANVIGRFDENFYATDFAQNLYCVDPATGAARFIGSTGIPALTFVPQSVNPDGSTNLYGESVFSARGKLYAYFSAVAINFETGSAAILVPAALYHINPETARARFIASTDANLTSIVNVHDTIYAFDAAAGQVVTLDLESGQTSVVTDLNAPIVINGATLARPAREVDR